MKRNKSKNGFWAGSYVFKIMDCGRGGYDLYIEENKIVHLSEEAFNAWITGQIPKIKT